ncbi:MAG: redox-sensing transcriptional repressor Rex [Paludibacteraceae bacterium]|nr:redox-sensing transcriptional repressor Rex [Paludibacteraceae bacterium]
MPLIQNNIPEPTLRRLPWYLAYAKLMLQRGETHISSTQIARDIAVDASRVAKDLSYINLQGRTRVGYQIDTLIEVLNEFLGFTHNHHAVLFGVGSLGAALLQDSGLKQFGLDIVAGYDIKYELDGMRINNVPIHHIDAFADLQRKMSVPIGIITVPVDKAQDVANMMVDNGIRAIWNFTPFRIHVPDNIVVQNTSIYAHLAVMFNRLGE